MKIILETDNIRKMGITMAIIYSYLRAYPESTTKEICSETNLSYACVNMNLLELEAAGYIRINRLSNKDHSMIIGVEVMK